MDINCFDRRHPCRLSFFILCLLMSLQQSMRAQISTRFDYLDNHIYVKTLIHGDSFMLAFDTGSPYTCVDSIYFENNNAKFKNIGKANIRGAGVEKIKIPLILDTLTYAILGNTIHSKMMPVLPLKPILGDYCDGLLGVDIIKLIIESQKLIMQISG